jgi:uncharacterized protein
MREINPRGTTSSGNDAREFLRNLIINNANRLRSGWRFLFFVVAYLIVLRIAFAILNTLAVLIIGNSPGAIERFFESNWSFVIQGVILLVTATMLGWLCGRVFEDLPLRALGWSFRPNWLRDFAIGSLIGAATLLTAALLIIITGGFRFSLNLTSESFNAIALTLISSFFIFLIGAAAEEVLFRGYPLQTVMRSWPVWIALLPTSLLFAFVHLSNPNIGLFAFINIALAGVWLTVAYWKTRSLWLPFGLHWSWNWVMGAALGSPVSGITQITPQPILRISEQGADWFTGGAFGIEGGAACTIAMILSSLFLWRTRIVGATEEMKKFTDSENPNSPLPSLLSLKE